jgi:PAS domain S-box-containing protein
MFFKNKLVLWVCFLFLSNMVTIAYAEKRVLLVSSYHPAFPTFFQQVDGIKDVFKKNHLKEKIHFDIEFMDTKRFPDKSNWDQFRRLLSYKIQNNPPYDVILVSDDNALIFALQEKEKLFDKLPIVFLGVNNIERALEQNKSPQITGIIEKTSLKDTIDVIVKNHPKIETIAAIVDHTPSGQGDLKSFYNNMKYFPKVNFSHLDLTKFSWNEFSIKLNKSNEKKEKLAYLLLSAYSDKNKKILSFQDGLKIITKSTAIPVYHLWFHGIGEGLIGGKVISHYEQGREAAKLVIKILTQYPVSTLKVVEEGANKFIFDHHQLKKFNISESTLPHGSMIINKPFSAYHFSQFEVILISSTILLLLLAFSLLAFHTFYKKQSEKKLIDAYQKLKSSEQNYREIFNCSSEAVFIHDASNGKIIDVNQTMLEIYGYSYDDVLKLEVSDLSKGEPPYDQETAIKYVQATLNEGPQSFEWLAKKSNGELFWVEVVLKCTSIGGDNRILAVARDITERKKVIEQLIQSEKMLSVGGLAAGMAHEINNPLAGILQTSQIISNRLSSELNLPASLEDAKKAGTTLEAINKFMEYRQIPRMLELIHQAGSRISQIVSSILSFSRKSQNKISSCDMKELVEKTLDITQTDYDAKHRYDFKLITIQKEFEENLPLITCDEIQLQQVLLNLFRNAAQEMKIASVDKPQITIRIFTKEAGPEFKNRSEKYYSNRIFVIEIEDNGPGIPEEIKQRIFEPFFTTKDVGFGTGLGLSVSYFIIKENHSGEMLVSSEVNSGAKFTILLPIKK